MRNLMLVALVVLAGSVVPAQKTQYITLRLELENDFTRTIRTREGNATAMVQLKDGNDYRDFYLGLRVGDPAAGVVFVSIRDGRDADSQALDEFELKVGAELKRTRTSPSFGVALLGIDEAESR